MGARKNKAAGRTAGPPPAEVKARASKLRARFAKAIPRPRVELDHENAWQLLIATILSAQSTDKTVNEVTPELFSRWPTPAELADAPVGAVEKVVHRTGFFRQKTKSIREASRRIATEHDGEVPRDLESALALPGVARKTANVVLGTAYGMATGIIVDTHARRVSQRLGLTKHDDPAKIEADLCRLFAKRSWVDMGHRLVLHGRYVCLARRPKCARCPLNELCPSAESEPAGPWSARARWEQTLVESRGEVDPTA